MNPDTPNTPPMTWTAAVMPDDWEADPPVPPVFPDDGSRLPVMPDDALDPGSLVGRMLRCDDVPPFSNQPRVGDPLPLWRVMHDAYWTEADVDISHNFPPPVPECIAAEIDALRDWLPDMPPPDLLQQWFNEAVCYDLVMVRSTMEWVRARLTEQARIARGEP